MGIRGGVAAQGLVLAHILFGWLSWRNYRRMPHLDESLRCENFPSVSIVIPARNEESRLPALLRSLAALDYPDLEVVVVDDQSIDGTARVARDFGVRVIEGAEAPSGWTGKCWACWQGAAMTTGTYLLFTDADTVHGTRSLTRAIQAATSRRAALLSLLPRHRCETFWERLLVPYAYALYFAGGRRGTGIANGQYMLFEGDAYQRTGGHRAVRGSLVEDVDIASRIANAGERVLLLRAERDVSVRMYDGLASIWEGFGKNAFRFIAASPRSGLVTAAATVAFASAVPRAFRTPRWRGRIALYLTPAAALVPWLRRADVPAAYALLHPLASATFQVLALDSMRRAALRRGTVWKGRRY